jgi:uroporphyrin-III C-methyltransferase
VTFVSNATMPDQSILETTLGGVEAFLAANIPATPAIVVVGTVAGWRDILTWYEGQLRENPVG